MYSIFLTPKISAPTAWQHFLSEIYNYIQYINLSYTLQQEMATTENVKLKEKTVKYKTKS